MWSQDCIAGLSRLGVGLDSVISEELRADEDADTTEEDWDLSATAQDFTDINEVVTMVLVILVH